MEDVILYFENSTFGVSGQYFACDLRVGSGRVAEIWRLGLGRVTKMDPLTSLAYIRMAISEGRQKICSYIIYLILYAM